MGSKGEPWLFLRRSLLLSADSKGGPEALSGRTDDGNCCAGRGPEALSAEIIAGFGLKVTFRGAFAGRGRRGVFSVVATAAIADCVR